MLAQRRSPITVEQNQCTSQSQTDSFGLPCHATAIDLHSDVIFASILPHGIEGAQNILQVTYTWEDPKIYAKPHTYRLIFDRAPKIGGYSYALEEWCDASDPGEGQSITAPKQL